MAPEGPTPGSRRPCKRLVSEIGTRSRMRRRVTLVMASGEPSRSPKMRVRYWRGRAADATPSGVEQLLRVGRNETSAVLRHGAAALAATAAWTT